MKETLSPDYRWNKCSSSFWHNALTHSRIRGSDHVFRQAPNTAMSSMANKPSIQKQVNFNCAGMAVQDRIGGSVQMQDRVV